MTGVWQLHLLKDEGVANQTSRMCHCWAEKLPLTSFTTTYRIKWLEKGLNSWHPAFPNTKDLKCFAPLCDVFIVANSLRTNEDFYYCKESALIPRSGGVIPTSTPPGHKGHLHITDWWFWLVHCRWWESYVNAADDLGRPSSRHPFTAAYFINTMSSRGTVHFKPLQSSSAQWQLLLHDDESQLTAGCAKGGSALSVRAVGRQQPSF